jgi:alcohol dehydrogenase (NADP+)
VKFCQLKGIHVSAHTPLGVPTSSPGTSDSGSGGEDEPGTPRISFRRSRSVHGPMLKLSVVAEIADKYRKTPEQVLLTQLSSIFLLCTRHMIGVHSSCL